MVVGSSSSIGRMEGGGRGRTDLVPLGRKNLEREGGKTKERGSFGFWGGDRRERRETRVVPPRWNRKSEPN